MNHGQMRVAIAEACGWTDCNWYEDNAGPGFWNGYPPTVVGLDKRGEWDAVRAQHHRPLPDYLADLNAMHEAEKVLTDEQKTKHLHFLWVAISGEFGSRDVWDCIHATAAQRAEAFLRTIGKWKDE